MRSLLPTFARVAGAAGALVALTACSFITGIPNVSRVEVSVAPRVVTVNQGAVAIGTAYDGDDVVNHARRQVVFSSSDPSVATIDPRSGQIISLKVGVTVITGSSGGKSDSDSLIVRLVPARRVVILSRSPVYRVGATNFTSATVRDSLDQDLRDRVVAWKSSDETVLTVVNGTVTPKAVGTAQVIATVDNGLGGGAPAADTVTARVTPAPITTAQIAPSAVTLTPGQTQQYTATLTDSLNATVTGRAVTWASANPAVVSVNASSGVATGVAPGQTQVVAQVERVPGDPAAGIAQGAVVVNVVPTPAASITSNVTSTSLRVGGTQTVVLTVRDANGNELFSRQVIGTPGDPAVAGVSVASDGLRNTATITARAVGTTTVTFQAYGPGNQPQGNALPVTVTVSP